MVTQTKSKKAALRRGPDPKKTRAKIMKAAKQLFVKRGLNGTSMRDIAQRAKVTQSLLHHHFGTKESLWQIVKSELLNHYFEDIARKVKLAKQDEKKFDLVEPLKQRFRFIQNNPDFIRMSLWQYLDDYKHSSTTKGRDLLQYLIESINKAQEAKEIRDDIDPAIIVVVIFVLTSGWFQQNYAWILKLGKKPFLNSHRAADDYLEAIQKIVIKGLSVD